MTITDNENATVKTGLRRVPSWGEPHQWVMVLSVAKDRYTVTFRDGRTVTVDAMTDADCMGAIHADLMRRKAG